MTQPRKSAVRVTVVPPADGCAPTVVLTVTRDGKVIDECTYAYAVVPCEFAGAVAVRWTRLDLDRPETYHTLFEYPGGSQCDCVAGCAGRVFCKHCEAYRVLAARRLLPCPMPEPRPQPIGV
jgi:hypothetical protein